MARRHPDQPRHPARLSRLAGTSVSDLKQKKGGIPSRGDEPGISRRVISRSTELRKAKRLPVHDCGPDCFVCLVAQYARTVKLHDPLYKPRRTHG
jgi:hypothetical protein